MSDNSAQWGVAQIFNDISLNSNAGNAPAHHHNGCRVAWETLFMDLHTK